MHVERVISLNEGWSILTTQKSGEWEEALAVLQTLDEQYVSQATKDSGGHAVDVNHFYTTLYYKYQEIITRRYKWPDNAATIEARVTPYSEAPPVKNGVLASIMGLDEVTGGDFATSIYLYTPYYFSSGAIDVAVYFVPSAASIYHFLRLGAKPGPYIPIPSEELCRTEMAKLGQLTSQAPIVLAVFSPVAPETITVEEASPVKVGGHTIERTIEFAPEYYQAGVGLLSYFGEVLRQKDPNTKAKVRIEQDGRIVRLHIESPAGDIETIEKELDQYALVISNQALPESLFENRIHVMQLESKLATTQVELKNALDVKQLTEGFYSQQVRDLSKQVDNLTHLVATHLLQKGQFIELMGQQNSSYERMQAALLAHSNMLFKDLLQEANGNQQLQEAVTSLRQHLLSGLATIEVEEQITQALSTVKQNKPGFLPRILTELEGATYKAAASGAVGAAVTWLTQHS